MDKKKILILVVIGILAISAVGYFGMQEIFYKDWIDTTGNTIGSDSATAGDLYVQCVHPSDIDLLPEAGSPNYVQWVTLHMDEIEGDITAGSVRIGLSDNRYDTDWRNWRYTNADGTGLRYVDVSTVSGVDDISPPDHVAWKIDTNENYYIHVLWRSDSSGEIDYSSDVLPFPEEFRKNDVVQTNKDMCIKTGLRFEAIPNNPPVADFTWSPAVPSTGQNAQFTDASADSDGSIASWSWNFGDGSTSNQQNPTHSYSSKGTYSVKLTVTDNEGTTDSITQSLTVTEQSQQTHDVTFTVKDSETQSSVAGANIGITGSGGGGLTRVTNSDGEATFPDLTPGTFQYSVSHVDYETKSGDFVLVDQALDIEVSLIPTQNGGGGGNDLTVYVVDEDSNYIENADVEVFLNGVSLSTGKTDGNGKVIFTDMESGNYLIKATYAGSSEERTIDFPTHLVKTIQITGGGIGLKLDLFLILAIVFLIAFSLLGALLPVGIGVRIAIIVIGVVLALIFFLISFGFISFGG